MNPKKSRGNILFAVLISLALLAMSVSLMTSLGTNASLESRSMRLVQLERVRSLWQRIVMADGLAVLRDDSLFREVGGNWSARTQRWDSSVEGIYSISDPTIAAMETMLFSRQNVLSAPGIYEAWHPLGGRVGFDHHQDVSAHLDLGQNLGAIEVAARMHVREVPISEYGLVLTEQVDDALFQIPIGVIGTTVATRGVVLSRTQPVIATTSFVAPTLSGSGVGISATDKFVAPLYSVGWGDVPNTFSAARNQVGSLAGQSFFDNATWVVTIANGEAFNLPVSGVEYRPFPGVDGPLRLIVKLNELPVSAARLYVNCVSAADGAGGVVVVGDHGLPNGSIKVVATNGAVWLWGDNIQPAVVASNYGSVAFSDESWSEAATVTTPLNQTWTGVLYFPATTTYDSLQAVEGAQLDINGTLVSGTVRGRLGGIHITERRDTLLKNLVPRLLFLTGVSMISGP